MRYTHRRTGNVKPFERRELKSGVLLEAYQVVAGQLEALYASKGVRRAGGFYRAYRVVGEVHVAETGALLGPLP